MPSRWRPGRFAASPWPRPTTAARSAPASPARTPGVSCSATVRSSTTCAWTGCCGARSSSRRTPAPGSCASIQRRPPASLALFASSPPQTCRANATRASSAPTGRCSSPRVKRPTASATSWPLCRPTPNGTLAGHSNTSGWSTRCCPVCSPRKLRWPRAPPGCIRIATTCCPARRLPAATWMPRWPPRRSSKPGPSPRN